MKIENFNLLHLKQLKENLEKELKNDKEAIELREDFLLDVEVAIFIKESFGVEYK